MSEQVKKLVPKLRFPEFADSEGWQEKSLHQICEVNPSVKKLPDTFVYIDLESVDSGTLLQKKQISLDGAPSRAQRLLKTGDVIFQVVRPYQKNNYFFEPDDDLNYVASTGYAQLRAFEYNKYLFQYLHNDRFVARVIAKCTGSNYPAINSSDLSEIKTEIPKIEEQQKIADCLSSLDDLITAQNQKVEALKQHKKGLMQNLFPAAGETVPKLRFPEFKQLGNWEKKTIDELCETFSGGTPSTTNKSFYGGVIPFIRSAEISSTETELFLTEDGLKNSSAKLVKEGNVLVALYGANSGDVAVSKINGAINQAILCLQSGNKIRNSFICHYLTFQKTHIVGKYIQGGQGNLSGEIVKSIKIPMPPIENEVDVELEKITNFLCSIDDLITYHAQKLEALKETKKGLMQQLFPSFVDA